MFVSMPTELSGIGPPGGEMHYLARAQTGQVSLYPIGSSYPMCGMECPCLGERST